MHQIDMIQLSSSRTFYLKFIYPLIVILISLQGLVTYYLKFHDANALFFLLGIILIYPSIGLKKISFDDKRIIVSNWRREEEIRFDEVKSIESVTGFLHPFQLELTMKDGNIKDVIYMPRAKDLSFFSRGPQGRLNELKEKWSDWVNKENQNWSSERG